MASSPLCVSDRKNTMENRSFNPEETWFVRRVAGVRAAMAPGSAKTVVASSNDAPCMAGFAAAFFGSCSNAHSPQTESQLARTARDVRQGSGDPVTPGFHQRGTGHAVEDVSRHE